MIEKISISEKLASFTEQWTPKIIGDVNDCHVKLAKLQGELVWHSHEHEDELFMVIKGKLTLKFRDGTVEVDEGEVIIVPRGVEHLPIANEETHVLLFEPKTTLHTGSKIHERTVTDQERI